MVKIKKFDFLYTAKYLAKMEKGSLYVVKYRAYHQNVDKKLKILGKISLIFALDPELKLATVTFVLHSGPKFMCLLIHFHG